MLAKLDLFHRPARRSLDGSATLTTSKKCCYRCLFENTCLELACTEFVECVEWIPACRFTRRRRAGRRTELTGPRLRRPACRTGRGFGGQVRLRWNLRLRQGLGDGARGVGRRSGPATSCPALFFLGGFFPGSLSDRLRHYDQCKCGERHQGNGDVTEVHYEYLRTGYRVSNRRARKFRRDPPLKQIMVSRNDCANPGKSKGVIAYVSVSLPESDAKENHLGVHKNSLEPAKLAGLISGDF